MPLLVTFTLSLFFGLVGCEKRQTQVDLGFEQNILHKANEAEPEDLDPHIVGGLPEMKILLGLFEGLLTMDPKDLHPIPGVAERWEIASDNRTYTFYLRDDASWSNGDPVTAHDFVYSAKRMLSRNLGAPFSYFYFIVEGAEDYFNGKIKDFSDVGIKALDDKTLQIKTDEPASCFLSILTHIALTPVHKATVEKFGAYDERGNGWTRAGNMVSNGPFKLKSWSIRESVVIEKNEHYWNKDLVKMKEIHFYPMDNKNTEERAYRTGYVHVTESLALPRVRDYVERNAPELRIAPYFMTYGFTFNTQKPPFDDARVRRAFSLALDRKSVVDKISKKGETPAFTYTPPNIMGYDCSTKLTESAEDGRRLLAEAGFPNGEGFPKVTLIYNTSDIHRSIAEALQYMWLINLGIEVELLNQEWKVYLRQRKGDDFNILRFGWVGDYLDPNAFLEIFMSHSPNNFAKWSNEKYDGLIREASRELSNEKRFEIFNKAEGILLDELPVLPLYFHNTAYLVHPRLKNWYPNILDMHPYQYLEFDS